MDWGWGTRQSYSAISELSEDLALNARRDEATSSFAASAHSQPHAYSSRLRQQDPGDRLRRSSNAGFG